MSPVRNLTTNMSNGNESLGKPFLLISNGMKHFFHIGLLSFILVIGVTAHSPVAHAQGVPCNGSNADICTPSGPDTAIGGATPGVVDPQAAAEASAASAGQVVDPKAAGTPTTLGAADKDSPYNFVMVKIMELFAWLLGVAALTLNYAVFYTVIKMGSFINSLSAVGVTWQILRDLGNILLIFGFLAIGISIIVDLNIYGWGKTLLPKLLMAAIFLNFSLFISEAVIDTGNLFATQFYQQIVGGTLPTQGPSGTLVTSSGSPLTTANEGISTAIMNKLGLQTIYGNGAVNQNLFIKNSPWLVGFMGIILFLVASFVLFSLAFVLISRFVILLYLIILSPVGFAGLAVPKLESSAKKWWAGLFEQSITAPLLLLTLYIALRVITDVNFLTGFGMSANSSGASTGFVNNLNIPGFASFILSFLVAMGLLLAVVIFSKKLSAFGAGWASKTAGAVTFGAAAWGGRTTGGWIAKKTASGLRGTWVSRTPILGTGLIKGLDNVASSSFDLRGAKTFGGLKAAGIEAGDAQKGGYKADLKERTESRVKYAADLKGRELTDDEKVKQAVYQNELKRLQKARGNATKIEDVKAADEAIKAKEKQIEELEKDTDKGAQRKYASVLNLGLDPKGTFNKYFNFAANTDAAKKIRETAKKGKPDKDWTSNMKNLLKEVEKESEEGADHAAPTPAASTEKPPSGYEQNSGGSILVPSSSGGGSRH